MAVGAVALCGALGLLLAGSVLREREVPPQGALRRSRQAGALAVGAVALTAVAVAAMVVAMLVVAL